MIERISFRLAVFLANKANRNSDVDYVRYGLEIVLGGLIKGSAILLLAVLIGMKSILFSVIATFVLFRSVTGGFHLSTYWRCFSFTIIILVGSSWLIKEYMYNFDSMMYLSIIVLTYSYGLYSIYKFVPANLEYRPQSHRKRSKLKRVSLLLLTIWFIGMHLLYFLDYTQLVMASIVGLFIQLTTLSPRAFDQIRRLEDKLSGR